MQGDGRRCNVIRCGEVRWGGVRWGGVGWGGVERGEVRYSEVRWGMVEWGEVRRGDVVLSCYLISHHMSTIPTMWKRHLPIQINNFTIIMFNKFDTWSKPQIIWGILAFLTSSGACKISNRSGILKVNPRKSAEFIHSSSTLSLLTLQLQNCSSEWILKLMSSPHTIFFEVSGYYSSLNEAVWGVLYSLKQ